jgi:hypothetical protein
MACSLVGDLWLCAPDAWELGDVAPVSVENFADRDALAWPRRELSSH